MGVANLPSRAIRTQIASAVDLIVQLERMRDGKRRVTSVAEVEGLEGEVITMNEVAKFQFTGEDATGTIMGHYVSPRARPRFFDRLDYYGLGDAWMKALEEA
jgi:pilus assembly protein CpaF